MSFLALSAFALLGLAPVIVFLYFLKLRRSEHVISSTLLWRKSIDDLRANAPFQRLRRNLLMILQLLVVALLVLALARPFLAASPVKGRSAILLIDNSASMNVADEGGRTRLERAKELARDIASQVHAGPIGAGRRPGLARAMVVSFGARAVIRSSFSDDRRALHRAIAAIEPTDTGTRFREALLVALAAARSADMPEIVVLSDGAFPPEPSLPDAAGQGVPMRYVSVGSSADNAGIVALSVRRLVEGGRGFEVFAAVHNYGSAPLRTTADLYLGDRLLDARQVEVPPETGRGVLFRHYQEETGVLKLKLNLDDGLAADNTAWAVVGEQRLIKGLLVSEGNFFLEKALALDPLVQLARIAPADVADTPPRGFDFVVFDNCAPRSLGSGAYLFIRAAPPMPGVEPGPAAARPVLVDWDPTHPVTRFLNFDPVYVNSALTVKLPQTFQVLLESTAGPLLAAAETEDLRVLYLAFDPYDSTWPFRVSFPVFVANATHWLARDLDAGAPEGRTGRPFELTVPHSARSAVVIDPKAARHPVEAAAGARAVFGEALWAGLYEVRAAHEDKETGAHFAVNLVDPNESDIRPRQHLQVNARQVVRAGAAALQKEVWAWFLFAALVLLMAEWLVYHRRVGV